MFGAVGYIGIIGILLMSIGMYFLIIIQENTFFDATFEDYLVFVGFNYLGLYIFYVSFMKKVIIKNDLITVYPLLGKPYKISFADIISAKRGVKLSRNKTEWITIKTNNGKRLQVDSMTYGYEKYYCKILELTDKSIRVGFIEDNQE